MERSREGILESQIDKCSLYPASFRIVVREAMPDLDRTRRSLVASHLLLVLCLSLVHSCLHFCFELDLPPASSRQTGSNSLSASPDRASRTSPLVETCVACGCQRHNAVALTAFDVRLDPLRLGYLVVELDQASKPHHDLDPGLSRAPPFLS